MSRPVLIVEDEESAARLMASLCAELGLPARVTRSGREALQMLEQAAGSSAPFACVILDLVLSELDGFQVGRSARNAAWGTELPFIVVSGVYKQLPSDFIALLRPAAFLAKPFEPSGMREALMRIVKGSEAGEEGDFTQRARSGLLVDLLRQKASGLLSITSGQVVRRITMQAGSVRFAQSNVKAETAGAAQVASGQIKQAAFDRAVADAKARKVPLHEALATARVFAPDQLKAALQQQTREVSLAALAPGAGTWRFEPQPPDKVASVPDLRVGVVALVGEAARKSGDAEKARAWLGARAPQKLSRTPDLERELFSLRAAWPGEGVSALAQGGRTLHEILPRVRDAELPLLQALCESGLLALSGQQPASAKAAPIDEDRGRVFSSKETEARRLLFLDRDRYKDADHYQMLGVATNARLDEIKTAYFTAAKKYHSDTFAGLELGSARRVAEELFRKVSDAYATLIDDGKRAEYQVFLDRKARGLPTDVNAILRAENIFLRGETQYRNGKYEEAEASFREALALNHAEAEFWAYLGMTLHRGRGKTAEALANVEKALQMDGKLSSALCFAGVLQAELGEDKKGIKLLEQALAENPNNAEAQRELARVRRKVQEAKAAEQKGGVFSRLIDRVKGR